MSTEKRTKWLEEELLLLHENYPHSTIDELVHLFKKRGFKRGRVQINHAAQRAGLKKSPTGLKRVFQAAHDPTTSVLENMDWIPAFDKFETVYADGAVICSDMQIPYIDVQLLRKMCLVAGKNRLKKLVIAGDFFNMDMFSPFVKYMRSRLNSDSWSMELEVASETLKLLLGTFEEILVTIGNHDRRILTMLMGRVGLAHIFKWVPAAEAEHRIKVSDYEFSHLISGGSKIRVTHPSKHTSKIPGRVAMELTLKHGVSVLCAHMHRQCLTSAANGKWCGDLGGLFAENRIEYVSLRESTYGFWNPGFFGIEDGFPTMFSRDWTDWTKWLT